jgi:hypothetical protein
MSRPARPIDEAKLRQLCADPRLRRAEIAAALGISHVTLWKHILRLRIDPARGQDKAFGDCILPDGTHADLIGGIP